MDIATLRAREKGTLLLAALTLLVIGLALAFSTWQNLQRQEETLRRHLLLTAKSVLAAVETSLFRGRGPGGPGMFGLMHRRPRMFGPGAEAYLLELKESGDVLFVGVLGRTGGRLLSSRDDAEPEAMLLPADVFDSLERQGTWNGLLRLGGHEAFVFAREAKFGGFPLFLENDASEFPAEPPPPTRAYLVVGLDAAAHMAEYEDFRRNALLQIAYILGAALILWLLGIALLRRQALAGRAASLEHFQARLFDNLPDGLITLGPDGTIQSANPAAHAILGAGSGELAGRRCAKLPAEVLIPATEHELLQGPRWKSFTLEGRSLEILSLPIRDEAGQENRLVLIRDLTESKAMEEDLHEAKKLAAVGTLAAGVAHEIRNPLSALRGFAQYFAKKFAGREPEETYARTMVGEADRLGRVITDLLFLANPKPLQPGPVDLPAVTEELRRLLDLDLTAKHIRLETDLPAGEVHADEDALKQALLNLLLNSIEALQDTPEGERRITVSSRPDKNGVRICVQDNGPGMTDTQRSKAFEPFFTDKRSGTGLGLAIVHKIMRDHNGSAAIESEPGLGATVRLCFPGPSAPETPNSPDTTATPPAP